MFAFSLSFSSLCSPLVLLSLSLSLFAFSACLVLARYMPVFSMSIFRLPCTVLMQLTKETVA
jgi:hypothetical protein